MQAFTADGGGLDHRILLVMRNGEDLSDPIGPEWLLRVATDLTALGGVTVLTLLVAACAVFLRLEGRRVASWLVLLTSIGATLLGTVLKALVDRPRPDVVEHLVSVTSASFPSGHALASATIYLTLGALLSRTSSHPATSHIIMGIAITLTLLIGLSRIYLGVHYPSDVLAGWCIGALWAWGCWTLSKRWR